MLQQATSSHLDVFQLRRGWRLQWEAAQECHVILYPEGMVKLSATAGEILQLVDGQQSVEAIIATLQQRYPEAETLADDVVQFLDEARSNGWLAVREVQHG
ncbi:pyrroloquinoline quinone biosynthesis peptide chaperone PqqD [Halomonas sp. 141]|uniref:pyrroloquinoline quinone biosynthesis peptide chaperone PqqD n=1 Tax=unclassified Halomonas TaxID=2609666 RepID=UPI000C2A224D|nr:MULTISPECIES: pyrroloquinoline quinone biosynthesis peptide chaperone PqqD [unclassified Halomonas]NGO90712.1 pyrroloquinoline quinone biosynthesis peptide chaperone PqqD [Halomonas sp.]PJX14100.1 pyrroloquinoline quinone biosynthesis peptide chaperone PqqD [Halomonas sp. 141]